MLSKRQREEMARAAGEKKKSFAVTGVHVPNSNVCVFVFKENFNGATLLFPLPSYPRRCARNVPLSAAWHVRLAPVNMSHLGFLHHGTEGRLPVVALTTLVPVHGVGICKHADALTTTTRVSLKIPSRNPS